MPAAQDVTDVRIEDEFQVYTFRGIAIASVSTRMAPSRHGPRQRARWFDASLYRKDDGSYLFHQVNHSTVFHLLDQALLSGQGHVKKPAQARYDDLGPKRVYCGVMPVKDNREHCPLMALSEARAARWPELVIAELPQFKLSNFPDAESVIRKMSVARHQGDGTSSAATSWPMRQLLNEARLNDPAFAGLALVEDKPVIAL